MSTVYQYESKENYDSLELMNKRGFYDVIALINHVSKAFLGQQYSNKHDLLKAVRISIEIDEDKMCGECYDKTCEMWDEIINFLDEYNLDEYCGKRVEDEKHYKNIYRLYGDVLDLIQHGKCFCEIIGEYGFFIIKEFNCKQIPVSGSKYVGGYITNSFHDFLEHLSNYQVMSSIPKQDVVKKTKYFVSVYIDANGNKQYNYGSKWFTLNKDKQEQVNKVSV